MLNEHVLSDHTGRTSNEVLSLLFHPTEQMLLSGDISGCIDFNLFDLDTRTVSIPCGMNRKPFRPHKDGSCRSLDFFSQSNKIASAGSDGRIVLSSFDPRVVAKWKFADPVGVVRVMTESLLVAGDDEGRLIGIDIREKKSVFRLHEQRDFISSLTIGNSESPLKCVLSTSGDLSVAAFDLRCKKMLAMSDQQEDEINCATMLNGEQHFITGGSNGVVGVWKQGYWGDVKDRIPLYNKGEGLDGSRSIEHLKKLDEKRFIVASSDGIIRLMNLYPNTLERVVGVHTTKDGKEVATISAMDCDVDSGLVATACGDESGTIKFWSVSAEAQTDHIVKESSAKKVKIAKPATQNRNREKSNRQTFFGDM